MRSSRLRFALALLVSPALAACGGDDDDSSGGSSAVAAFEACGGDPEGTWQLQALEVADPKSLLAGPLAQEADCKDAVGDVEIDANGSYVFGKDKSVTIDITYSVDMQLVLGDACLQALSGIDADSSICEMLEQQFASDTTHFSGASCSFGNAACNCSISGAEIGVTTASTFAVDDDQIMLGTRSSDFCIRGDRFEIKTEANPITGVIVLER